MVTVGIGGAGGSAQSQDGPGNSGEDGGESVFGTYLVSRAGNRGSGGQATNSSSINSHRSLPSGMGILNSLSFRQFNSGMSLWCNYSGGGGSQNTIYGVLAAQTFLEPSGGGAGGYNAVNNQENNSGGFGGSLYTLIGPPTRAEGNSVSGTTVTWGNLKFGSGGSGGQSANSGSQSGGNGGNGGYPGGGGGGGGAANRTYSNRSGAGGSGGGGAVFVITYF